MNGLLGQTAIVALLSAFALSLLIKWEVVEWLQVHGTDLVSRMANCGFCLSWWTCVLVSVMLAVFSCDVSWVVAAPCATPITRRLI